MPASLPRPRDSVFTFLSGTSKVTRPIPPSSSSSRNALPVLLTFLNVMASRRITGIDVGDGLEAPEATISPSDRAKMSIGGLLVGSILARNPGQRTPAAARTVSPDCRPGPHAGRQHHHHVLNSPGNLGDSTAGQQAKLVLGHGVVDFAGCARETTPRTGCRQLAGNGEFSRCKRAPRANISPARHFM